ncbi:peroxide stress protein YaaA [Actinomycetospora sp. NBRC 106378]|uniref:YaaA family protein n=1 Tax=Actinomycetospora sp. NBRC 106378 TaxID=3032208 RepID=UPI0024A04AC9|nr:peroxide stress protein YaaA [Actinomycetospora sp. NBRC 106378]GLZ55048.1 peroxide stress protein YaaA [Actinomycetospora sp. NBRC 106378]
MLVVLPPSETKAAGGRGAPLDLDALSFPALTDTRAELLDDVVALADDVPAARAALGISERQDDEIERNAALRTSRTAPALRRYTGVLYDALDAGSLTPGARRRIAVCSALFGLVMGTDPIPAYRLSADSALPGRGGLRTVWRPVLGPVLADLGEHVVDLRSGGYMALAPAVGATTLDVVSEAEDGSRSTVSHANKSSKGRVARLLASTRRRPRDTGGVLAVLADAGLRVEQADETSLLLVVPR